MSTGRGGFRDDFHFTEDQTEAQRNKGRAGGQRQDSSPGRPGTRCLEPLLLLSAPPGFWGQLGPGVPPDLRILLCRDLVNRRGRPEAACLAFSSEQLGPKGLTLEPTGRSGRLH